MEEPSRHFAIKYHIAKELANALKAKGITKVMFKDERMALRLKFYDIAKGGNYKLLNDKEVDGGFEKITIAYYGIVVKTFYLYDIG